MINPFANLPGVVKNLLIINVLMWLATVTLKSTIDLNQLLGLYYFDSEYFQPYQLVTHMFMHDSSNIGHLFFNMFALYMFGRPIELTWGPKRFLFYYLFCGFGAAFLQEAAMWYDFSHISVFEYEMIMKMPDAYMVGASGAVFGLLGAFGMLFPNSIIMLLFPPIPMKAKYFVILYGIMELTLGVGGFQAGVAHFAHVGGLIFGVLLILYWNNRWRFRR